MLTLQHSPTNNFMLVVAEWAVPKASMSTTTLRTKIIVLQAASSAQWRQM